MLILRIILVTVELIGVGRSDRRLRCGRIHLECNLVDLEERKR